MRLLPEAKEQVGGVQLRFSLPGPSPELSQAVERLRFSAPTWQLLEKEVVPYICSPAGIKGSVSPAHLEKAEIAHLDSEHRSQKGGAPFDSALARTQKALETARLIIRDCQLKKQNRESKALSTA